MPDNQPQQRPLIYSVFCFGPTTGKFVAYAIHRVAAFTPEEAKATFCAMVKEQHASGDTPVFIGNNAYVLGGDVGARAIWGFKDSQHPMGIMPTAEYRLLMALIKEQALKIPAKKVLA